MRTVRKCLPLALLWGAFLLTFPALAQSTQQTDTPLRIRTDLIQIDVVVKDAKGHLLRDLRREDFTLLEDGQPQTLTHFARSAAGQSAAYLNVIARRTDKPTITPVNATGRHIVLAVDDYHLVAENLVAVKQTLLQFVAQQLAAEDQIALTATSGALSLHQPFTRDRAVIQRAINRLSLQDRTSSHIGGIPQISAYQAELIEQGDPGALQIALEELRLRQGKTLPTYTGRRTLSNPNDPDESVIRAKARSIVLENTQYTVATLAALESTIRQLRDLPGRKILVFLSDGFVMREARNFSAFDLRRITDAATRAGVVIYSIDARGLVAKPTMGSAADPQNATVTRAPEARIRAVQGEIGAKLESLFVLARDTGGLPFFNNNDLSAGLQRVLDDTEAYYVLAYEPTNTVRDGRFRKLEVRVPSHPEAKVQTRTGYFAPADEVPVVATKKKEKSAKTAEKEAADAKLSRFRTALNSLLPLRGIPVELGTHFVFMPPTNSLALITARIDATQLNFATDDSARRSGLEVVGVILDESGKTVQSFSQSFDLKRGAESLEQMRKRGLNYHNIVPLGPGRYNVRLAIADDEMQQIGTAFDWLEIPAMKSDTLRLSSIFLTTEGANVEDSYHALAATLQSAKERKTAPLQPVRRFSRDSNFDFLFLAYHAQPNAQGTGGVTVQIKTLAGAKEVYASPPQEMPLTAEQLKQEIPYIARLSLLSYAPGEYELRVEVTDHTTKQVATRSVAFTVE